jgi:hypothetical protein
MPGFGKFSAKSWQVSEVKSDPNLSPFAWLVITRFTMKESFNHPHRRRVRIRRRSEHGQSLIEFALIVPGLLIMLIGVAFIAQGFNLQIVLHGAAYEGRVSGRRARREAIPITALHRPAIPMASRTISTAISFPSSGNI